MTWTKSLIRISTYEVETLQKRLSEVVDRRCRSELEIAVLDAELESERNHLGPYEEAGFYLPGYREGARIRREAMVEKLRAILTEEAGARDALAEAFESLKKYEHVAKAAKAAQVKEENRRETAALDELGLRKSAG